MGYSAEHNPRGPQPPAEAEPVASPEPSGGRIEGLDAARALAIIGMVMIHFGPSSPPPENWPAFFYGLPHGRASLLFVMLAGIGMTFLTGHRDRLKWKRAWARLVTRVAILLPLGLSLELLDIRVYVILHFYALFFVLAIPATLLRDRLLLLMAVVVAVAGPVAYRLIERSRPEWFWSSDRVALDDPPGLIAQSLLLTGPYPAIVWIAPFLLGMWLGRQRLRVLRTRLLVLLGGVVAFAVASWLEPLSANGGWWELADTKPHSKTILWLVQGTGCAAAVLAICLILTDLIRRLMWPLIAMGQLALTIYVSHLLLLAADPPTFTSLEVEPAIQIVFRFILGAALFAVTWRWWFTRGPIEGLIHCLARGLEALCFGLRRIKELVRPRPGQQGPHTNSGGG